MARHYSDQGFGPPRDDRRERDYGSRESREHFEGRGGRDVRQGEERDPYRDESRGSDRSREGRNVREPEDSSRYLRSNYRGSNESFDQGRYQTRRQGVGEGGSFGRGGRSNFGASRYGGSDYESNDFGRNESRYGSPYSDTGERQFARDDEWWRYRGGGRSDVVGNNWTRTAGTGDWVDRASDTEYDEPYGFLYGEEASYGTDTDRDYGQGQRSSYSGQSAQGFAQSARQRGQDFRGQDFRSGQASRGQEFQSQQFRGQEQRGQDFRGKGPRGYQRSDDRLREIICEALTDAPHIDASDIHVEVTERVVKLSGSVPDRRTKYAAEDLVERKSGLLDIRNELKVRDQEGPRSDRERQSPRETQASQSGGSISAGGTGQTNAQPARQEQAGLKSESGKSESRNSGEKTKGGT